MRFHKNLSRDRFNVADMDKLVADSKAALEEMARTGRFPERERDTDKEYAEYRASLDGKKRLAYYRSHGLDRCDDYPGGDAQFEADVLSGEQRCEDVTLDPLGREDEYIIARMRDGRFKYGPDFGDFPMRPEVGLAYRRNAGKNNFMVHISYVSALSMRMDEDIESGAYARRVLEEQQKRGT